MAGNILLALCAFSAITPVFSHTEMSFPPPLRSKFNPLALKYAPGTVDYSMTSPLTGPSQMPCKGYQSDLSTPAGASVATFNQGAALNLTISGSAVHGGGSCQASLSYDQGKSFYVIHSWEGACPMSDGEKFDLTIPSDAPTGAALFAWTWNNEEGNRELYMNCASITIGAGSAKSRRAETVPFSSRPDIFVAATVLNNGCNTIEGQDVVYPNPGPSQDVTSTSPKGPGFSGTCLPVNGIGGRTSSSSEASGAGSGASSASSAPAASSPLASSASKPVSIQIVPTHTASSLGFLTSSVPAAASTSTYIIPNGASSTGTAPAATGSATSSLTVTKDGQCGGTQTCMGSSQFGHCCSQWGFCGVTSAHCGSGCMAAFGTCGNTTSSVAANVRALKARGFLN